MVEVCAQMDAEIRVHAQRRYFTVMVWKGWARPDPNHSAEKIQAEIQALSAQYPHVVCYCYDTFSTLVYLT